MTTDTELVRYGHAPGNYYCLCGDCKERYTGDKRSVTCRPCAEKRKAKDTMTTPGATEAVTPEQRATNSIWKWTLRIADEQIVELPEGAKILDVQIQGEMPQLWALVNPAAPKRPRKIAIYGTGHPVPENPGTYIASFQMHDGSLVFHAFESIRSLLPKEEGK